MRESTIKLNKSINRQANYDQITDKKLAKCEAIVFNLLSMTHTRLLGARQKHHDLSVFSCMGLTT